MGKNLIFPLVLIGFVAKGAVKFMFSTAYVWAKIYGYMEEQLGAVVISTWFDDAEVVELTEDHLILYTSSDYRREMILKRFSMYRPARRVLSSDEKTYALLPVAMI